MGVGKERYCDVSDEFVLNESGDVGGSVNGGAIVSVERLTTMSISTLLLRACPVPARATADSSVSAHTQERRPSDRRGSSSHHLLPSHVLANRHHCDWSDGCSRWVGK